jgi:radical SAM superfamily enzyme YgiQ (UPF0313 family)
MPDIVLATLNAKYIHASFGLRCLRANLGELRARSALVEFTVQERPLDVAERILALEPRIVALGVYVWNVAPTTELVGLLKRVRPELVVILGGPEVSHEPEAQEIVRLADCTIRGEGERVLPEICRSVLAGGAVPAKVVAAEPPDLETLVLAYDEYTEDDIAHRLIYVEASRGCPFSCEFCLSSLDEAVRAYPLEPFLAAMERLLARGVRHFKFVDRTFNLNVETSRRILEFFLGRMAAPVCGGTDPVPSGVGTAPLRGDGALSCAVPSGDVIVAPWLRSGVCAPSVRVGASSCDALPTQPISGASNTQQGGASRRPYGLHECARLSGLFLHFEMIPDRLPAELRELLVRFPAGSVQLEIGIQSFDPAVTAAIGRRQDLAKLEENFRYLREHTAAHVHADLIVGLPGETVAGFAAGFDRLVALGPQEIQVGMLKRLRGAPIARHDGPEAMVYSPAPPYEILQNRLIDFPTMQRLRRFARYWELVGNSGNFVETLPLLWGGALSAGAVGVAEALGLQGGSQDGTDARSGPTGEPEPSPFAEFLRFSDWFFAREGRHHALALSRTMERVFEFLVGERGLAAAEVAAALVRDCRRIGYLEVPAAVRAHATKEALAELAGRRGAGDRNTKRQSRHRGPVQ